MAQTSARLRCVAAGPLRSELVPAVLAAHEQSGDGEWPACWQGMSRKLLAHHAQTTLCDRLSWSSPDWLAVTDHAGDLGVDMSS